MNVMKCPWCGSEKVGAQFVDIGVGMEQATPYECDECGARQMTPDECDPNGEARSKATDEEWRRSWWAGEVPSADLPGPETT